MFLMMSIIAWEWLKLEQDINIYVCDNLKMLICCLNSWLGY